MLFFPECGSNFTMPQVQLPIFPAGVTHINSEVAFEERDGRCTTLTAICRCLSMIWELRGGNSVGKTPVWSREDAKTLLDSIPKDSLSGLRDRALIAAMLYSFARVTAVLQSGCLLLPGLYRGNDRLRFYLEGCCRTTQRILPGSHPSDQPLSDHHTQAWAVCGGQAAPGYNPLSQLLVTARPTMCFFLSGR